ncbi:hypothetical protein HG536_0E03230 [Torulaspora globosa]|uniref:Protein BFR2 n=1 Tax=Torulaspora globosa TaxID=48254 RepID=A0A7G3ZIS6_9SACH|nr:uncharacterized protein HG536_0E03230 [Torulaspora globosa]QLL33412.1 hypothetical protein HG536_0E03230 [Torulaspora globosa]
MGRFVADEISELANRPANKDYDIEDGDAGVFEHREVGSSDDEVYETTEANSEEKAHYAAVGKSRLRDDRIELDDDKYQGAVGSREEVFGEDSENEVEGESESDAVSLRTDSEDELISEESESEAEEVSEAEDAQYKRERLAKLIQQETSNAVKKLSETTRKDAAKGLCILEQNRLFENIIDVRIKLQKALNSANSLPVTTESWKYLKSDKTDSLVKESQKLLTKVLNQMIDFRNEFHIKDHISQESEKAERPQKRSISDLTKETDRLDDELSVYRSAVLNKWSTKVASASGSHALTSSKFKAINQPADVQVRNQLADTERLLKRTCLSRRGITPFRFHDDLNNGKLDQIAAKETQDDDAEDADLDIPRNYDPRKKDNNAFDTAENPYIFDDEDFYRVLLNDLVDKKISDARTANGTSANIAITSRSTKLKKNVDTKASKGRKLNYSIQEPIANYEAPRESGYKWSDEQIDEFFAGFLGQRIDFAEHEETALEEDGDKAEQELIKKDDIQIFG